MGYAAELAKMNGGLKSANRSNDDIYQEWKDFIEKRNKYFAEKKN